MQLPRDSIIAPQKLTDYLLRLREDHDKSGYLALAGYSAEDAAQLESDIRDQLLSQTAESAGRNPYGEKFIVRGTLIGPNGRSLRVISIWMLEKATGLTKFITLYPDLS